MKPKHKKKFAIATIILLVSIYIIALIASIFDTTSSLRIFSVALYATFIVPVLIYVVLMLYNYLNDKKNDDDEPLN